MTMTADERLIAYLDDEMAADERALFEADMEKDERLATEVAKHRGLAQRISMAYAPVLEEPVPARLRMIAGAANDRRARGFGMAQWIAMAACLVVGVSAGGLFWPQQGVLWPDQGPLSARGGALVAQGPLDKALTSQLAGQGGPIAIGLSFKAGDGRYCRTFQSAPDRLAGVACRTAGRWQATTVTAFAPAAGRPDYRTAGVETPLAVLAAVDAMIAGPALDLAADRAARDKGWKP